MKITFKHNIKEEADLLKQLQVDIKKAALSGIDKAATQSLTDLKNQLRSEIKAVEFKSQGSIGKQTAPAEKPEMPKYKSDIIEHLTGKKYTDFELTSKPTKDTYPCRYGSGFYTTVNGRFEVKVPMQHGLSANDYKRMVKDSFRDAIFVDPDTGEAYQLDPNFVDGMKLKCSHKERSDDERLDAAINNGQTEITVTAYKDNFKRAVDKAIPLGPIVDLLVEADYGQAQEVLRRYSDLEVAQKAIQKVEEMKTGEMGQDAPPDAVALNNAAKLINNIRIKKIVKKDRLAEYVLVSSYQADGEKFENLYDQLTSQISFWLIGVQDKLVQEIIRAITELIESKYGGSQ